VGDVALPADDVPGIYAYEDTAQGERLAQAWLQAKQAPAFAWRGQGQVRSLAPGQTFSVVEHPMQPTDAFVALSLNHRARSNLGAAAEAGLQRWLGDLPHWASAWRAAPKSADAVSLAKAAIDHARGGSNPRLRNASDEPVYVLDLTAQPASVPVRAPASALGLAARPTVNGTQTALVVGVDGPVHTDRDHRVKVQFHWQRGSASSHGLAPGDDCNAPASDASGTWVRVAEPMAGDNWGTHFVPRLGQEVVISFLNGDIDRPVVDGAVYNGIGQAQANDAADAQGNQVAAGNAGATGNAPAWFPGQQAAGALEGHNHNAVLQGFKSQELQASADGTGGYNQLVFDDTPDANRIELGSTMQASRLQLGHLLHQRDNQRLDHLGHGFDLRTDAHGAVRAGSGLLLSTHERGNSTGGSQPMDSREPQTTLQAMQGLVTTLAGSAQQHEVKASGEPTPDKQPCFMAQQGLYESLQATEGDDNAPYAVLGRPDLVLGSQAGIVTLTPGCTISAANTVSVIAGQDITITAQRHHAVVAVEGVYFFTYSNASNPDKPNTETGIKLHAATGSVSVQAASAQVLAAADQDIDLASTSDAVTVGAPEHVLLTAGGSALQIEKGAITITTGSPAKFLAATKSLDGAASASTSLALPVPIELPTSAPGTYSLRFAAIGADAMMKEAGWSGQAFSIFKSDGTVLASGVLGDDGRLPRVSTEGVDRLVLQIGSGDAQWICLPPPTTSVSGPDDESAVPEEDENESRAEDTDDQDDSPSVVMQAPTLWNGRYYRDVAAAAESQYDEFLGEALVAQILSSTS
jgi:type VI secretion system secreted protein VgrG